MKVREDLSKGYLLQNYLKSNGKTTQIQQQGIGKNKL